MKKKKFNIKDRLKSFGYAFNGLKSFILEEHNARIHLTGAIVAIVLGFVLEISQYEWIWIALAIALVFITEMLNTSIEALCDEVTTEQRPNIKKAKDIAATSVLVASCFAIVVALFVFIL